MDFFVRDLSTQSFIVVLCPCLPLSACYGYFDKEDICMLLCLFKCGQKPTGGIIPSGDQKVCTE